MCTCQTHPKDFEVGREWLEWFLWSSWFSVIASLGRIIFSVQVVCTSSVRPLLPCMYFMTKKKKVTTIIIIIIIIIGGLESTITQLKNPKKRRSYIHCLYMLKRKERSPKCIITSIMHPPNDCEYSKIMICSHNTLV